MFIGNENEVFATAMSHPEVKNASMKVLISPQEGWRDYVMRMVELDRDGYSPRHVHAWPHINYVVEGKGLLHMDGKDSPMEAGAFAYVPAGVLHQYRNAGDSKFRFICIVPKEGHVA